MPVSSASPCDAAQCSAVMPSAWAMFTSLPAFRKARTAAASPAIAASAIVEDTAPPSTAASRTAMTTATPATRRGFISPLPCGGGAGGRIQIERAGAVAERIELGTQAVQHGQHGIGHRRPVRRLHVQAAFEAAAAAEKEQRTSLVVVNVRVPHRRPVEDDRVIEQAPLAVGCALQLLEQVRQQADVIPVDFRQVEDAILTFGMMRGDVKPRG